MSSQSYDCIDSICQHSKNHVILREKKKFLIQPCDLLCVPTSSIGKISYSRIKDFGFNFYLHQKPIDVLI